MTGEVNEVGETPANQRIDGFTIDLRRPDRVSVVGVIHSQAGESGSHQQVIFREDSLYAVINFGSDLLILIEVYSAQFVASLNPMQILRWKIVSVFTEQIRTPGTGSF